jgi:hypothetical protein
MRVIVGVGGLRSLEGTWDGIAEKSLPDLLAMAHELAKLPAFDWERDGMTGDTGWLSIASAGGNGLLLYFNGTNTASFEWYPFQHEPGSGKYGRCGLEACMEAIRCMADNASPWDALLAGASEVADAAET